MPALAATTKDPVTGAVGAAPAGALWRRLTRFAPRSSGTRLIVACLASLLLYALAFGVVLDRPLTLGFLRQQADAKLARAAAIEGPKLVILAGSNGPYSHRCESIETVLGIPCVNGGVAVGIGLDYVFARWEQQLQAGDIVYLPMEEAQYVRPATANAVGPDAAIMFRHDWRTLYRLSPHRWIAALFSFDLRAALMAPIEAALIVMRFHDPRAEVTGATNAWGDHVGHTTARGAVSRSVLAAASPHHASADDIRLGDGSALIAAFTRWASTHGIRVIGGLPTEFEDAPMPDATRVAIRSIYLSNGGEFFELSNLSRYPRIAFFDTAEHLNETWQIVHSQLLAEQIAGAIPLAPPQWHPSPIAEVPPADPAGLRAQRSKPTD